VSETGSADIAVALALKISSELAEYAGTRYRVDAIVLDESGGRTLSPEDELLAEYDRRILDSDLRLATRTRFVSQHYADVVEAAVKSLNQCIRTRSGRNEDGDELMAIAFNPKGGLLRINKGRSKSDESAQRGHMLLCQGVVGAWRNPRAHSLIDDSPVRALMMLETIGELIRVTKAATRTRRRRSNSGDR
jgi:uncharacterized protein (TIGR02391 family)